MTLIVAIAGKAGSGKDTLASMLQKQIADCGIISFADPLREIASTCLLTSGADLKSQKWKESDCQLFPKVGINRMFMIKCAAALKTEFGQDFFTRILQERIISSGLDVVIIPDLRYRREMDFVLTHGGIVVRIVRPDLELGGPHAVDASETDLDSIPNQAFASVIYNDSTLADLHYLSGALAWKIIQHLEVNRRNQDFK